MMGFSTVQIVIAKNTCSIWNASALLSFIEIDNTVSYLLSKGIWYSKNFFHKILNFFSPNTDAYPARHY